jgi:hypothetical protein
MATSGRHGLHPVAKRPKTATEKLKDHLTEGGEGYSSGARGATPAILGMKKADEDPPRKPIKDMTGDEIVEAHRKGEIRVNRSYRPGQPQHPDYAKKQKKVGKKEPTEPPWWVYMKSGNHTGTSTKRGAYYARDIQKLEGKQTKARVVDSAGADIHGLPYVKSIEHGEQIK